MPTSIRQAITRIINMGIQLSPDAIKLLSSRNDLDEIMAKLIMELDKLREKPMILTSKIILELTREAKTEETDVRNISPQIKVIFDSSETISLEDIAKDFVSYFVSRYRKLRRILIAERLDTRGAVNVEYVKKSYLTGRINEKIKVIVMINSKRKTENSIIFEAEDLTGDIKILVSNKNPDLYGRAIRILRNEVVCVEGRMISKNIIFADDIIQPEVPRMRLPQKTESPILAVLISDLHIGSKHFMRSAFNKFILWINGLIGNDELKRMAARVKYLIIAGDLVEGIGVYPGQEEELLVRDLKRQYKIATEYLAQIPRHVRIIIIPGNHDASRQALPTPKMYMEYAEPLYKLENVMVLGDPAYVNIHGTLFLITHGKSLDDILANTPGVRYDKPEKVMIELLKRRHLAPIYGGRTQISPEREDFLVMEKVPQIFHAGHLHTFGYEYYNGVLVVNTGTWQEQTEYMKSMGIHPNPAKAALVDLNNRRVHAILNFKMQEKMPEEF
ncbi:MAG: DNA-directed DNA polymerase II small subunit [archaeon GB-1845-036]|nr:DNA-directed DNA polymerase II small subunit [Candidatus Culexmicrobium thermophilum]